LKRGSPTAGSRRGGTFTCSDAERRLKLVATIKAVLAVLSFTCSDAERRLKHYGMPAAYHVLRRLSHAVMPKGV